MCIASSSISTTAHIQFAKVHLDNLVIFEKRWRRILSCANAVFWAGVVGGLSKDDLGVLTEAHIAAIPQHAIPHIPPTQFNVSAHRITDRPIVLTMVRPRITGGACLEVANVLHDILFQQLFHHN